MLPGTKGWKTHRRELGFNSTKYFMFQLPRSQRTTVVLIFKFMTSIFSPKDGAVFYNAVNLLQNTPCVLYNSSVRRDMRCHSWVQNLLYILSTVVVGMLYAISCYMINSAITKRDWRCSIAIIVCMGSANGRRRYIVTPPVIGCANTHNESLW